MKIIMQGLTVITACVCVAPTAMGRVAMNLITDAALVAAKAATDVTASP